MYRIPKETVSLGFCGFSRKLGGFCVLSKIKQKETIFASFTIKDESMHNNNDFEKRKTEKS